MGRLTNEIRIVHDLTLDPSGIGINVKEYQITGDSVLFDFYDIYNPFYNSSVLGAGSGFELNWHEDDFVRLNNFIDCPIFIRFDDAFEIPYIIDRPLFIKRKFNKIFVQWRPHVMGCLIITAFAGDVEIRPDNWQRNKYLGIEDTITVDPAGIITHGTLIKSIQPFFRRLNVYVDAPGLIAPETISINFEEIFIKPAGAAMPNRVLLGAPLILMGGGPTAAISNEMAILTNHVIMTVAGAGPLGANRDVEVRGLLY